jgi:hypothetical protein
MYVGELRAAGLAKETTVGTLVTPPTRFIPYIPPDGFHLAINLIESMGIRAVPDMIYKVGQGLAEIKGAKLKIEMEPENCGEILMACMGVDTLTGSSTAGYTHTFTRLVNAQLPTYTWWFDKGAKYPQFPGCMLNKLDIAIKAKDFVQLDTDWTALKYDDTGTSQSPVYSTHKPFVFNQAVVQVDSSTIANYDDIKITIDNQVKADPTLNSTIYSSKIYSEGMKVEVSMTLFFEDTTQWAKFLAGTSCHLNIAITSAENIAGTTGPIPFSLTIDIPTVNYKAAPITNPKGVLKIPFTGVGVYTPGSSKTISLALVNSVSASY